MIVINLIYQKPTSSAPSIVISITGYLIFTILTTATHMQSKPLKKKKKNLTGQHPPNLTHYQRLIAYFESSLE